MNATDGQDRVTFGGAAPLRGRVRVPGDKSISHRALLFAAMADGDSRIRALARGADVRCTATILEQLGVSIGDVDGDVVVVGGRGVDALREPDGVLDCGNSGTTMRTAAGLLAGRPFLCVLTGDDSLRARPMARVIEPLGAMGARIDGRARATLAPIVVRGGALQGAVHTLTVASAQVKTALVLAGLQADGVTEVIEPAPSRDHTERMLGALGAPILVDHTSVRVETGAPRPFELEVPGDPSSAAFWCVAATITPGSDVTIEGVALNPTRIAFIDVLRRMGASIEIAQTGAELGEPSGQLRITAAPLHATAIGNDEIPLVQDEVPVLAVAAAFAEGITEITGAAELRVKESDRIATVAELLTGLGIGVETDSDGLRIRGGAPRPGRFVSHRDHRIAMAAAVSAHALDGESTVSGWSAATVSYPEFLADLAALVGQDA